MSIEDLHETPQPNGEAGAPSAEPASPVQPMVISNPVSTTLGVLVCGLGLGWLVGLSLSPVLHTVLTSLLTIVVGVVTLLSGLSVAHEQETVTRPFYRLNMLPVALLILCLVAGSSLGVLARTNLLLGPIGSLL